MSFSPTLFLFMFDKSFRWFILFIFGLVLIGFLLNSCSIEQDNERACRIVEERVAKELKVHYLAKDKFSYSEISYNKPKHIYSIRGNVKIQEKNSKSNIRYFSAVVKAYNNDSNGFKVEYFYFEKQE